MSVTFLSGNDESILRDRTHEVVSRLVGDGDRGLLVDEFDGDEYELREVVDAAQTLPFLTDFRVVVARGIDRFNADEFPPLVGYLDNALDTTHLVLVHGAGRVSKKLSDAVAAAGGERINTSPPTRAKDRVTWIRSAAESHGVRLDSASASLIADRIGEASGRLEGILDVLASTYGEGVALRPEQVEPFLGEAGDVPPWDLTDAIDAGRTADALTLLTRMTRGGGRHPLQIMATLTNHYGRLARLDGAHATDENAAAIVMGIKPGFPAKKALNNYRRLGGPKVKRAVELLARADLDLRGDSGLDPVTVMEILIARLSRL